jgi:mannose-6-phosphate isomerase-like protein (cupin superfamily)
MPTQPKTLTRPADAEALPLPPGRQSRQVFIDGQFELRHYAPKKVDDQKPHDQDEIYIVISGHGAFLRGEERVHFGPGDVLFAAAKETHRFVDFSDDFACWVMFYGSKK